MNVVTMLAGGSSLVLEEPKVDVACLVTLTFGNNVTEPRGSHLLELAVADGTGKVGTCRHRGPNNLGMWSEDASTGLLSVCQLYVCGTDKHRNIRLDINGSRLWLSNEGPRIIRQLQVQQRLECRRNRY